jgi:FkbM family methyltransferase
VCGSFDLLHVGQLSTLRAARWYADVVVAGVFDDGTTRLLKGPGRPVQPDHERLEIIASLNDVDFVTLLSHEAVEQAISLLRPDVYVTGEHSDEPSFEIENARAYGVEVVFAPFVPGRSIAGLVSAIGSAIDQPPTGDPTFDASGEENVARFNVVQGTDAGTSISRDFTFHGASSGDLILNAMQEWKTFYEGDALRYLTRTVPRGGVIVDVGANIGNHAVFFAVYMAELVIAIEPAPELAALLRQNLAANLIENATVIEAAAGAKAGEGYVVRPQGSVTNAGATQVRPILNQVSPAGADLVPITTIDAIVEAHAGEIGDRTVTLLKIDVEGNEYAVLAGSKRLLAEHRPHLLVEITLNFMFTAISEFLRKCGYVPFARLGGSIPMYYFLPVEQVPERGNWVLR